MRSNIKLSLYKLAVLRLLALFNNVIEKLTENAAVFAAPPIALSAMKSLRDDFSKAITDATDSGTSARKKRDNLVPEVRNMLRTQADYVRSVCSGNAELLALSGFELSKMPEPIKEVGIPQRVKAEPTDETGNVLVRYSKALGGRMYRTEQASGDPALGAVTWTTVAVTARQRVVISGLEPFKAYFFRVVAMGITHEGLPSDIVVGRAA
jgi:hypothetical protein